VSGAGSGAPMPDAGIERWIDRGNGVLTVLAGGALLALMTLTFVDVIGRKFWRSVPGALELSEMLMVAVLFCALPLVSWRAEHVCFELADAIYKGRAARWSRVGMDLICAAALGTLGWACWGYAGRTLADGDVSVHLGLPIGWLIYLMAAMLMASAALHLLRCVTVDQRFQR
jgi:TRAP-type C4-dicarboxylate transport system permease small subunit